MTDAELLELLAEIVFLQHRVERLEQVILAQEINNINTITPSESKH